MTLGLYKFYIHAIVGGSSWAAGHREQSVDTPRRIPAGRAAVAPGQVKMAHGLAASELEEPEATQAVVRKLAGLCVL